MYVKVNPISKFKLMYATCSKKSWVRIPPEAAHFSLKKGRWVVSGGVALFVICNVTLLLSTSVHVCYIHM